MHLGDDRGIEPLQQQQGFVERAQQVLRALHRVGAQRGQVAARHKGATAAMQQHGAHRGVLADGLHGVAQRQCGGQVQRVPGGGAVEAQRGPRALAGDEQGSGVGHGLLLK
ncbi:hypothetical protein SDC9_207902 [bioreactor metagenome]|uniref:Uncharacterized protein n=1 Tax=bioreactor metagenome TaxID=1076179 RepID=A0A645J9U9_9ZZZZ